MQRFDILVESDLVEQWAAEKEIETSVFDEIDAHLQMSVSEFGNI